MPETYPLSWPTGWPRSTAQSRVRGRFKSVTRESYSSGGGTYTRARELTIYAAMRRITDELDRLGACGALVSSNLQRNNDGTPRSQQREPDDPGVAVYFQHKGQPRVLACDRYDRTADNMAAIAAHLDAMRTMLRHGVGTAEQAFAGYQALPPPNQSPRHRSRGHGGRFSERGFRQSNQPKTPMFATQSSGLRSARLRKPRTLTLAARKTP